MWEFEWDEAKRLANIEKHGIDFINAIQAFNDPGLLVEDDLSERYDELRLRAIGQTNAHILTIAYTERGENVIRLISARRATKREIRRYGQAQHH